MTLKGHYLLINWLLEIAKTFKLRIKTAINALDLLSRYLTGLSDPIEQRESQALGLTLLLISAQLFEAYAPEINDLVYVANGDVDADRIRTTQLMVLQRLNQTLTACEIDDYVDRIEHMGLSLPEQYDRLHTMYQTIYHRGLYSGSLPYEQIMTYLE